MTILVSGASGFMGSAITRHLLSAGQPVRAMSRSSTRAKTKLAGDADGRRALEEGRLTFVEADVTAPGTLRAAVEGVSAVIQAAQFTGAPVEDPARGLTYDAVDRAGTINLLAAVREVHEHANTGDAPRFLYLSGITVSAEAGETWNRAKWLAEEAIRGSGLSWTIVRASWAFGPDDTALNRILHYSDFLPFVPMFGRGQEPLTPVFVEDVGSLFALLCEHPERSAGTTFGLGGPDEVTLPQFLQLALEAMGRHRPILKIPQSVGRLQGALLQHVPGRPLTPAAVDFVSQGGAMSAEQRRLLAERFQEFRVTTLREGLSSYLRRK